MRKKHKHILFILTGILIIGILVFYTANYFAHKKLVTLLKENSSIIPIESYEDLKVNVWNGNLHMTNVVFKWDVTEDKKFNTINSKHISLHGIKILKLWKDEELKLSRLDILDSEVQLISHDSTEKESVSKRNTIFPKINIAEVNINNVSFSTLNETNDIQTQFELKQAKLHSLKLEDWKSPNTWFSNLIHYKIEIEELYHKATNWEAIKADKILLTDTEYNVQNLDFYTELEKKEYNEQLPHERDHYNIKLPHIKLSSLKWDRKEDRERFFVSKIALDSPDITIYRDKLLPDDTSIKPLFSQLLRELDFEIQTNGIHINDGAITYTERVQGQNNGGSAYFSEFDAVLTDAGNFKEVNEKNPLRIQVESTFIKTGKLTADRQFNPQDKNDAFHFQAEIYDLDAHRANTFMEPNLFVKMEGKINHIYLNIYGNNTNANTDFAISYNDLKVKLIDKDSKTPKKLISAIANIFVRRNSESDSTKLQEEKVEIERDKTKSIFNFLWKNTLEGLKKTILRV